MSKAVPLLAAALFIGQLCWITFFLVGSRQQDYDVWREVESIPEGYENGGRAGSLLSLAENREPDSPVAVMDRPPSPQSFRTIVACEVIHLVLVSRGSADARDLALLLKGILLRRSKPLHVHVLANNVSKIIFTGLFRSWRLKEVHNTIYSFGETEVLVDSARYALHEIEYLIKIVLPEVLPQTVRQVLVLSPRQLMVADVYELWSILNGFTAEEGLGFVRLDNTTDEAGVMLMHLSNLRRLAWPQLWRTARWHLLLTKPKHQITGQMVIDAVLEKNPELLKPIPCQWDSRCNNRSHGIDAACPAARKVKVIYFDGQRLPNTFWREYLEIAYYDGALLRGDFTLTCNTEVNADDSDSTERQQRLMDMYDSSVCKEYFQELIQIYRTHLYYVEYSLMPRVPVDITIATQLSFDRIGLLEALSSRWPGPISAAIYLGDVDARRLLTSALTSSVFRGRSNIGFHLVFRDGPLYPTNYLRNVALTHVATSHVFLLDVDFMPSQDLYDRLQETIVNSRTDSRKMAIVVPAFETEEPDLTFPRNKADLIVHLEKGAIYPFRSKVFEVGHGSTNFKKWKKADAPYKVPWKPGYEPYIVIPTAEAPLYSELFSGWGMNKIEQIVEVTAKGFKLLVIPDGFIVHFPHSEGFEKTRVKSSIGIQRCKRVVAEDFARALLLKYGPGALEGWKPKPRVNSTAKKKQ